MKVETKEHKEFLRDEKKKAKELEHKRKQEKKAHNTSPILN